MKPYTIVKYYHWKYQVKKYRTGELGESGQKVQISSYKINKLWVYNLQHGDYC